MKDTAKEVFKEDPHPDMPGIDNFSIFYRRGKTNTATSPKLTNFLKKKGELSDLINSEIRRNYEKEEISNISLKLTFVKVDRSSFESTDTERITTFLEVCLKKIRDIPEHKFVIKDNDELLEEAKEIREELIKRIEEPWRI